MVGEDNSSSVLKAKIEWYREILILEPNSKVFLPFARHLAEIGSFENNSSLLNEAFDVLRRGLLLHPDFMEARLFHIELLNACDCRSQCGAEVARLASLFLSYPDFWDAWREHSIVENESNDFTVALGFMGAILKDKKISIVQVLEAGLASLRTPLENKIKCDTLINRPSATSKYLEKPPTPYMYQDKMDQMSSFLNNQSPTLPDLIKEEHAKDNEMHAINNEIHAIDNEIHAINRKIHAIDNEEHATETSVKDECGTEDVCEQTDTSALIGKDPYSSHDIFPESHIANYLNYTQKYEKNVPSAKETLATLLADASITVEPMEVSPFRTRSMAEVLSEQGDLNGAIEIYRELVNNASDSEVLSLKNRLAELENCINNSKNDEQDISGLFAIDDFVDTSFFDKNLDKIEKKTYSESVFAPENISPKNISPEDSTSEDIAQEDITAQGSTPEDLDIEAMMIEKFVNGEIMSEELLAEEILAVKLLAEKLLAEELVHAEFLAAEFLAEELLREEHSSEAPLQEDLLHAELLHAEPLDEEHSSDAHLDEEHLHEEFLVAEPSQGDSLHENVMTEAVTGIDSVIEDSLSENTKTNDELLDNMSFDEFIGDEFIGDESIADELVSEESITDELVSEESMADELVSEDNAQSSKITKSTDNIVDLLNKLATRLEEKANI